MDITPAARQGLLTDAKTEAMKAKEDESESKSCFYVLQFDSFILDPIKPIIPLNIQFTLSPSLNPDVQIAVSMSRPNASITSPALFALKHLRLLQRNIRNRWKRIELLSR